MKTGETYQHNMGNGFLPYRRDVGFLPCQHIAISALLDELSFTKDKENWGQQFRRGYFEISENDFKLLAKEMGATIHLDAPEA